MNRGEDRSFHQRRKQLDDDNSSIEANGSKCCRNQLAAGRSSIADSAGRWVDEAV